MTLPPLVKIQAQTAGEICAPIRLSKEAKARLQPEAPPLVFLEALLADELWSDAVKFLAYALPKREAVWWGCLCAWQVCEPAPTTEQLTALRAAAGWAIRPDEKHRWAAQAPGKALGLKTPAGNLATAAFVSEGSLLAANLPRLQPDPTLTHKFVSAGLLLAALAAGAKQRIPRFRMFVALGIAIAEGKYPWPA